MATRVIPGKALPALDARIANAKGTSAHWSLAGEKDARLVLLAFYRGVFCPICRVWAADLDRLAPEFEKRGVATIALSCDRREGAEKSVKDWGLKRLRVGYGLDVKAARKAGLYISRGRGMNPVSGLKETRFFTEPALLLASRGRLYAAWVQSTPYARVHASEILTACDNFLARDLPPPRGSA